ncbi:MAG: hypothetical protein JWM99_3027 [Verrucomicrobiales bacterium]|nr:hypothetical protein [Verrucomicrobiales bacterium]
MNNRIIRALATASILLFSCAAFAQTNGARNAEALIFKNGDTLYGQLQSIGPTGGVSWTRSDLLAPVLFTQSQISEIEFPAHPASDHGQTNHCRVQLINDDQLEGNLLQISEQEVILETWYANVIHLPRKSVLMIVPIPASKPPIFTGPISLDGWTQGTVNPALTGGDTGEWKFRNQAFYASKSASIARIVGLPDSAKLEFDMAWKGFFYLAIALYTDYLQPVNLLTKDTDPNFGGFYSLQINNFSVDLLPVKRNEQLRRLGLTVIGTLNQKTSAHFDIRMNKSRKLIALIIDGVLAKSWTDIDSFAGEGKGLRFVHQGQGSLKLSNIKVSEWDGVFDEAPTPLPGITEDTTYLRDSTTKAGSILGFQNGNLNITNGPLSLNRVRNIQLGNKRSPEPTVPAGKVRAYFATGGGITGTLEQWERNRAVISSPNFGRLEINPDVFSKLEF